MHCFGTTNSPNYCFEIVSYWFYASYNETSRAKDAQNANALLWTILFLIPIANLFAIWMHSTAYSEFVDAGFPSIVAFILWIVFSPVA